MTQKLPDQIDVVISPDGDDKAEGTWEQPVQTLQRAQQLVRERLQADPDHDRHVVLRGGTYPLRETIVFSLADAPGPDSPAHELGIEPLETDRAGLTEGMPFWYA